MQPGEAKPVTLVGSLQTPDNVCPEPVKFTGVGPDRPLVAGNGNVP